MIEKVNFAEELPAYADRAVEAIAVLRETDGILKVAEANRRFTRTVGQLAKMEKLDFIECLIKDELQAQFRLAVESVRSKAWSEDEMQDTIITNCDTLLLGNRGDLPVYKKFDWAIFRGLSDGAVVISGRRVSPMDEKRKEMEDSFMDFFNKAPIALHWLSSTGHVLWANETEMRTLGYTAEEYIGQPILKFCPDSSEVVLKIFQQLGSGNTIRDVPVRFRTKTGEIRDLLIDSNVRYHSDGSFRHTRCFIRDDTRRKIAEARAETARVAAEKQAQAKEAFSRKIFHEILTPCHTSLQCLQCASGDLQGLNSKDQIVPSSTIELIEDAEAHISKLVEIVQNAEDASRFEQGFVLEVETSPFSLRGAMRDILGELARMNPPTPAVSRTLSMSDNCPDVVIGDKHVLCRALKMLVGNAINFTARGSVEVSVAFEEMSTSSGPNARSTRQGRFKFAVSDTGPGIEPERINAIFQKYWEKTSDLTTPSPTRRQRTSQSPPKTTTSARAKVEPIGSPAQLLRKLPKKLSQSSTLGTCDTLPPSATSQSPFDSATFSGPQDSTSSSNDTEDLPVWSSPNDGGSLQSGTPRVSSLGIGQRAGSCATGAERWHGSAESPDDVADALDMSDLSSGGGLGLGLNVCFNLVQCMGGTLEAKSDPAVGGSRFSFDIVMALCRAPEREQGRAQGKRALEPPPSQTGGSRQPKWPHLLESKATQAIVEICPADTWASKQQPAMQKPGDLSAFSRIHVLVVDDNTICQKVVCRALASLGCTTEVATNGREAVEAVERDRTAYSVVLMDLRMPIMDGIQAARAIRHDLGITHLPIVPLSAERGQEIAKACTAAGMDGFLHKPSSRDKIIEQLNKLGVLTPKT